MTPETKGESMDTSRSRVPRRRTIVRLINGSSYERGFATGIGLAADMLAMSEATADILPILREVEAKARRQAGMLVGHTPDKPAVAEPHP